MKQSLRRAGHGKPEKMPVAVKVTSGEDGLINFNAKRFEGNADPLKRLKFGVFLFC